MKVIAKVEFQDREPLIIKFVKQNDHPHDKIEKQSEFSEYLRGQGVLTPKRYKRDGNYCIPYQLGNMQLDVTVEDYMGEAIKTIDFELAYKIT